MDRERVKALISADDEGRLSFGGITLDANNFSIVSRLALDIADDGVLLHAIDKFKSVVHPFTAIPGETDVVAKQQPLLSGPIHTEDKEHGFTDELSAAHESTTIHFNILQRGQTKDLERTPSQASRAFEVASAYAGLRSKYHILECVTPLEFDPEAMSEKREARRFEVFLCAYEKATENISWLMYTFSAGERFKGEPGIPFTSWALHPVLPILAWLIPGHSLRIARIDSHESPVTLSGKIYSDPIFSRELKVFRSIDNRSLGVASPGIFTQWSIYGCPGTRHFQERLHGRHAEGRQDHQSL